MSVLTERNQINERRSSRNTGPMLLSPRCGAKTRSGKPCRSPAVDGKKRCRMHGGAPGSGARAATRTRSSMGSIHEKPSLNADSWLS